MLYKWTKRTNVEANQWEHSLLIPAILFGQMMRKLNKVKVWTSTLRYLYLQFFRGFCIGCGKTTISPLWPRMAHVSGSAHSSTSQLSIPPPLLFLFWEGLLSLVLQCSCLALSISSLFIYSTYVVPIALLISASCSSSC